MNALAKSKEGEVIQANSPDSLMAVIARAVADPKCDVDKMERLLGMHERITARAAKAAYTESLVALKPKLPIITKRGAIDIGKGKPQAYALWEDIDAEITPLLADHGFVLTFRSGVANDGKITVTGVLAHKNGHSEETTITLPHDSSGSKNAVQAVGSSTSYGKRYTATLLLNIRTKGEDDDGKAGGDPAPVSKEQLEKLIALADDVGADKGRFCQYLSKTWKADIDALAKIPAAHFQKAMDALEAKRKKAS